MKHNASLVFILLFISGTFTHAQQVTRGPYLQKGTPSSMVMRWRTDSTTVGKVDYGMELSNLQMSQSENSATIEHEIEITGLAPNTVYYYNIGTASSVLLTANGGMYFKTSPVPGSRQPIRIWAIGDFGNGSPGQFAVMNSYMNFTGTTHTDIWMWLGDNAYGSGTQQEYQTNVFNVYIAPFRKMVAWPCPGNHDYGSVDLNNNGPYFDIFTIPKNGEAGGVASTTEGYYSYDYGNVHFISLNSESLAWTLTNTTAMANWLKDDLENNDKDWVIVYWHQPPYTKGSHDSDEFFSRMGMMRTNINPILEEHGVDLVLCGHSHCYERSYMIKGHYGASTTFNSSMVIDSFPPFIKYVDGDSINTGTVYAVVGCSGQLSASGSLNHPVMAYSTYAYYGSLVVDIDSLTLTAKFLTSTDSVKDEFTIQKVSRVDTVTAIGNWNFKNSLAVAPNPARGTFNVEFNVKNTQEATLALYNIRGKKVAVLYEGGIENGVIKNFSVRDFPSGLYFLNLNGKDYLVTTKIVLSR